MEEICKLKYIYRFLYNFEKEFAETNGITINEGMILCCMKDGNPKRIEEYTLFDGKRNRRYKTIEDALLKMNEINENK